MRERHEKMRVAIRDSGKLSPETEVSLKSAIADFSKNYFR